MPEETQPRFGSLREAGRLMACEGIMRSRFGQRSSAAAARAIKQLRDETGTTFTTITALGESEPQGSSGSIVTNRITPLFRWLPPVALAACLVITLWLGYLWWRPETAAPVLHLPAGAQDAFVKGRDGIGPARDQQVLQPGDTLTAGPNSPVALDFARESTELKVETNSQVQWLGAARGKRFLLGYGKIDARVARQPWFHPLVVTTPQAEARVVGTEFSLLATKTATRLTVTKGRVLLTASAKGQRVEVTAGHYARVGLGLELAALPLTGGILREYWTNVPGVYHVLYLRTFPDFPDHPAGREVLKRFEGPSHAGDNYGARYRGFLHPPSSGQYTFWISADDSGELYLSLDDNPAHKQQIAYAGATGPRQWELRAGQKSAPLTLVAGRRYYVEVLHKQSTGEDHLAVAWKGPDFEQEVIPGEFIEPFIPQGHEKKQ
jgi:hypothetical protein